MDGFDLGRLTDFDFEEVCKDIVENVIGERLEIFAPGADGGVDLRGYSSTGGALVVQCKHWYRSGRTALLNHMRDKEAPKVKALAPDRYVLATSVDLTVKAKERLMSDLAPFVVEESDLLGESELVALLRSHPEITRRHFRLWLASTQILEAMLAKEVLLRSGTLMREVEETLRVFAPSPKFNDAQEILTKQHVCIIAGIPGIGKTTLAQVLAAEHAANDFEIVEISGDIEEALKVWQDDKAQFFYYDDFLGQTSLRDTTATNEDSRLIRFIKMVKSDPQKRFVLTTREYILAQARQQSEKLASVDLDVLRFVLDIGTYTTGMRARVLYNHIFFSRLPSANKAFFADPAVYKQVLLHPNFSPRLVALTFDSPESLTETPEGSLSRLMRNLQSPSALWRHMFDFQLTQGEVDLVDLVFTFRYDVPVDEVRPLWIAFSGSDKMAGGEREFRRSISALEGTLLRVGRERGSGRPTLALHNPSVRDFLRDRLGAEVETLARLLGGIKSFEQMQTIWLVSDGERGIDVRQALLGMGSYFPERARELFLGGEPSVRDGSWALATRHLLEMADATGDPALLSEALTIAKNPPDDLDDLEDLASLINVVATDSRRERKEMRDALVPLLINWLDTSDWDNAKWAEELLESISGSASVEVEPQLVYVREQLFDLAVTTLGSFQAGSPNIGISQAREVVEFLSEFSPPFPGVSDLSRYVEEQFEALGGSSRAPNPGELVGDDFGQDVHAIMGALRD